MRVRAGIVAVMIVRSKPWAVSIAGSAGWVAAVIITALLLSSCGSSKPGYCKDVTNFKNAVGELKNVKSPSDLVSAVQKVQTTGQAALSAVKTGFSSETSAVKSSLQALEASVKQLTNSATRASALTAIPGEVSAVGSAAQDFANAAKQKC